MAESTEMIASDYGVKKRPITTRIPQANSMIERMYQTIGNVIRSFDVHNTTIDEENPLTWIFSA
eukprot:2174517-Ditylum_brightwellii.AAC.1